LLGALNLNAKIRTTTNGQQGGATSTKGPELDSVLESEQLLYVHASPASLRKKMRRCGRNSQTVDGIECGKLFEIFMKLSENGKKPLDKLTFTRGLEMLVADGPDSGKLTAHNRTRTLTLRCHICVGCMKLYCVLMR
jgi:hypothetical protein